jgi:iron complex transport system substrate-binding protein
LLHSIEPPGDGRTQRWRAHAALPLVLLATLAIANCDRQPDVDRRTSIEVTGDNGATVRLDSAARRIVSLIPGRTDVILALGGEDLLIARTQYDRDPRIAELPALENALTPSVEWLAQQKPDLVIAWPDQQSRSVVTRLVELGIPVYTSNVETLEDTRRSIRDIGTLTARTASADSLLADMDSTIARTQRAVAALPRTRVLYLIGLDPPMAAGPGTFVDEMIAIAGGENVLSDAGTRWPPISVEEVLNRRPDVLIVAMERSDSTVLAQLRAMPGMRRLGAVRDGRVHVVDPDIFNRPGPGLIEAIRRLAAAVHPGVSVP